MLLHARVATNSSRVSERALRARGSPEFKLTADRHTLENTVGATCSADALAAATRVTTTFPDADHHVSVIVKYPLSGQVYLPRSSRPPEYFPPCMVSQCAATGLVVFDGTGPDAIDSVKRVLTGIGAALDCASVEILRFYAQDVQADYRSEVHRSYGLMSLHYDNCIMFGHACKLLLNKLGHRTVVKSYKLRIVASQFKLAALEWTKQIRLAAERKLRSSLDRTSRNGGLGAYGTLTRLQYGTALMSANSSLNQVI